MLTYAKTNVQLFNQLRFKGYSNDDIVDTRKAYDLVLELFTGLYRPSGSTFISHAIGTASILVELNSSKELIIAGLLHAAYEHGDFGIFGIDTDYSRKRKHLKMYIGEQVEEYISKYTALKWNSLAIEVIRSKVESLSIIDRNVLLIRIANELDDNLDLGALYCPDAEKRKVYINRCSNDITNMAVQLGFSGLAVELKQAFTETLSSSIAPALLNISGKARAYRIPPLSYKKRLTITLGNHIFIGQRRLKKLYVSVKNKL